MRFRSCTIGEFVESGIADIQTGPFGTQLKASEYVADGIPVINVRNIGYSNLRVEKLEFVTEQKAERLGVHRLKSHDIVFGRKGAVDRHLFVQSDHQGWVQGSDCIRLRIESDGINPRFISYAMLSEQHKKWMLVQCGNKATMASLNHDVVKRIPLEMPDRNLQDSIVATLSAYDDLIENNRRRIALLEEAARQLYKEWFVRFRFPGHEHVKIVNGAPDGWERKSVSELSTFLSRGITPTYDDEAGGLIINQKCIRDSKVNLKFARRQSKVVPEKKLIRKYDVLVNSTGAGTLGRVAQNFHEHENLTVDSHVTVVRVAESVAPVWFGISLALKQDFIATLGRGATNQTELSKDDVGAITLIVPPDALLRDLEGQVAMNAEAVMNLLSQNLQLTKARDLLLPKLLSGAITV